MQGIRNIIFDAGGVLIDVHRQDTIEAFQRLGVDVSALIGTTRQKGLFLDLEMGLVSEHEFCDGVRRLAQNPSLSDAEICKAWNAMLQCFFPHRLRAVDQLAKHYNIAILSNTNSIHWRHCEEDLLQPMGWPLNEHVSRVYLSHELHMAKPDEEIFQEVLRRSGFSPEETLLVDDSTANCATARALGLHTFTPTYGDEWIAQLLPSVATIGFFDGVHRGHQCLLRQVQSLAQQRGMRSTIVTFDNHPRQVLHADYVPQLLTTLDEKERLLASAEVDSLEVLHFDQALSQLTGRDFMLHVLRNQLGVRVLVMGYDHRFGHGGGTFDDYVQWGRELGIEVVLASELAETKVSSSIIRTCIASGDVVGASVLLGRPYEVSGVVEAGKQVGRTLGFPTANLCVSQQKILPARGVYAVQVETEDGTLHQGMACIGSRPTLDDGRDVTVEVHIFDYEGDLYGQTLTIRFLAFLREERKFASLDELRLQLQQDASQARM